MKIDFMQLLLNNVFKCFVLCVYLKKKREMVCYFLYKVCHAGPIRIEFVCLITAQSSFNLTHQVHHSVEDLSNVNNS